MLLAALFMPWAVNAQETVEIGTDGGTTTNQYLPGYTYYDNTLSEQIYTAEEVTMAGTISSVAFYNGGSTKSPTVTLYMVNTDKEAFENTSDWLSVTENDKVFEDLVTFTANEWTTITLDTPFEYDGTSNLGLVAHIHMAQYSSGLKCYVFTSTDNCSMYAYRDNTVYDPTNPGTTGTRLGVKNQIKLEITPSGGSTCEKPSSISFGALNTNSVIVNWDGGSGTYNIEYKKASDEEWTVRETNYSGGYGISLINLTPGTDYNVRVQSVCGEELSGWKTGNFTTLCEPVTSFPWSEDFESYATGDFSNPCWVNEHVAGSASYVFQVSTSTLGTNSTNQLKLPDEQDGNMIKLVLPEMVLPSTNCQFSIDVYRSTGYANKPDEGIRVYASRNGVIDDEQTVELAFIPRYFGAESGVIPAEETGNVWYTYELPIPMSSTCYIILRGESKYGTATYMDNFMVQEVFCDKPTDLAVSNIAATSATFSWTENGDATTWQICFDDEDPYIESQNNPAALTGFDPETEYSVKVRSYCGDGKWSPWSPSVSFTTLPSCLVPTNVQVIDITARTATVTWEDANEAQLWEVELLPTSQEIWQSYSTENPFGGLVPETQYTVRVRAICDALNGDNSAWSEAVTFTTLEACPTPSDLTCTGVTGTTATLSWTENGEAETWRIEYAMNSDWSDLQSVEVTENPYTLEGLNTEATYRARVIAICGEENESHESNVVTFEPTDKILIGSGTGTISGLPFNNYYKQSLTQQIYTVEELGDAGVIESIDFYKNNTTAANRNLDIYMVGTDKNTFNSNTDWIAVTAADLVFSGSVSFNNNAWTSITLDNGFIYDGTQNVAIIVDDNTGSFSGSSNQPILAFEATSQAISVSNDNTNYDPTNPSSYSGSVKNMKNQIRILKGAMSDCMRPTNFAVGEIGSDFVTLSWTENGASESWVICYTDYDVNYTQTVGIDDLVNGTYTLQGLTPETYYVANVIPSCGVIGDEYINSLFSNEINFTTDVACPAPHDVEVTEVLSNEATLAWAGTSDSYNIYYREVSGWNSILWEGFENDEMPTGWTVEGDNQDEEKTWRVGTGDYSASTGTHTGNYNALITHNTTGDETYLITPAMDLSGENDLLLSFWYVNRDWSGDKDYLGVYYRVEEGEWHELWSTEEAHSTWTNQVIELEGLAANYQIGFKMTDSYGYGVGLDDVNVGSEIVNPWNTITVAEGTTVTLTELYATLNYEAYVVGICDETESGASSMVYFETYSYTFDNTTWPSQDDPTAELPTIDDDVVVINDVVIGAGVVAYANSIILSEGAQLIIEDGGQLYVNEPVDATVKKSTTHENSNGKWENEAFNWYTIASPLKNSVNIANVTNLVQDPAENYDLYEYNEQSHTWWNSKDTQHGHDFNTLNAGTGYLYWNSLGETLEFAGELAVNNKSILVTKQSAVFSGFNLIGNPFSHNIYKGIDGALDDDRLAYGYYILDNHGGWATMTPDQPIKPCQGFLVQVAQTETSTMFNITINNITDAANGDYNGTKRGEDGRIMFAVSNSQYSDATYAVFNESAGLSKISHRNNEIPMVYVMQNGEDYAIATMSDDANTIDLGFKAQTTGSYTLSMKSNMTFGYMHLIDRLTGADIDMLAEGEYSFIASPSDREDRFVVSFGQYISSDSFVYQRGEELIVNGEGTLQMFDVTGRFVGSYEINGVESIRKPAEGVYVFRMVGETVKTQKIIVR